MARTVDRPTLREVAAFFGPVLIVNESVAGLTRISRSVVQRLVGVEYASCS